MELEEDSNDYSYSSQNNNHFKSDIKNPLITKFSTASHFIYESFEYKRYFQKIRDKNRLKLSNDEFKYLEQIISDMEIKNEISKGNEFIGIENKLAKDLFNFYQQPKTRNPLEQFLLEEFAKQESRTNFTCRKLAKKYESITKISIGKSTIYNILKNHLGLKWRKTTIKTNKIKRRGNILMMLTFIKIVTRCIYQKFNIIYCDESSLQTFNNHLKIWTDTKEDFTSKLAPKKRFNLLMAINENEIVHFKINKDNTNKTTFLDFMKELNKILNDKKIKPYVIILDNLSCHKTKELIDYFSENKINIIFNAPYISKFNAIEYSFRDLKKIIYSRIYHDEEELISDVNKILISDDFRKKLINHCKEAYLNYLNFYKQEKVLNLNNIDAP